MIAVDQNAVETAITFRLARQIVARGENDALALARRDACRGATEIAATALAHLDEDQAN